MMTHFNCHIIYIYIYKSVGLPFLGIIQCQLSHANRDKRRHLCCFRTRQVKTDTGVRKPLWELCTRASQGKMIASLYKDYTK